MSTRLVPLELVESIAADFADRARQKQVHLNGYGMPGIPMAIMSDEKAVRTVLTFLTERGIAAVDHMKDGSVLIEALADKSLHLDQIRFGVSDSRSDISVECSKDLVEEILDSHTGSGTCRQLLESLGTTLQVDIELLGRATRFYFAVPAKRTDHDLDGAPAESSLRDLRIFLVSNDPPPNRIIQYYLRHAGVRLEGSPTAAETMVELGAMPGAFQMVVVAPPIEDMKPDVIAQTILQSELPPMKLLYIAPWEDKEANEAVKAAGFDEVLSKPFTKKQLFDTVAKLSGRKLHLAATKQIILIVEDNPINARVAFFQLKAMGFDAEIVNNGKEAVDAIPHGKYAAVLMDMRMPVMDGFEATKTIRAEEQSTGRRRIPIIALTANAEYEREALSAGCDCFLTKPAQKPELEKVLRTCLEKSKAG